MDKNSASENSEFLSKKRRWIHENYQLYWNLPLEHWEKLALVPTCVVFEKLLEHNRLFGISYPIPNLAYLTNVKLTYVYVSHCEDSTLLLFYI